MPFNQRLSASNALESFLLWHSLPKVVNVARYRAINVELLAIARRLNRLDSEVIFVNAAVDYLLLCFLARLLDASIARVAKLRVNVDLGFDSHREVLSRLGYFACRAAKP